MKKTFRFIGNIIIGIVVFGAILSMITVISSKITKDPIPTIGSYKFLTILSDSMAPQFKSNDLIIDKKVSSKDLISGDIITFKKDGYLVTHRISSIEERNGIISYRTKGDANNIQDEELIKYNDVVGKYVYRIPYGGFVISTFKGTIGILLIWVIIISMIIELLIKSRLKKKKILEKEELVAFKIMKMAKEKEEIN